MSAEKADGSRGREVAAAVSWASLERWVVRLGGLLTFVVLGRLLDPVSFGLVAVAAAVVTLIDVVTSVGFSTYLVQSRALDERTINTAFWSSVCVGLLTAGILFASAPWVSAAVGYPEVSPILRWLALSLVLGGLASTPTALLVRRMAFRALALRRMAAMLTGSTAGIVGAVLGAGPYALVIQTLVTTAVNVSVALWVARWPLHVVWDRREALRIASYGVKTMTIEISQQCRDQGELLIIGALLGPAALGLWTVGLRIVNVLLDLISSSFSAVALPLFARLREDRERMMEAYGELQAVCALVSVPLFDLTALTAVVWTPLIFGTAWAPSGELAGWVAWGAVAASVSFFDRPLFIAMGKLNIELVLVLVVVSLHLIGIGIAAQFEILVVAVVAGARNWITWPLRVITVNKGAGVPYRLQRPTVAITAIGVGCGLLVAMTLGRMVDDTRLVGAVILGMAFTLMYLAIIVITQRALLRRILRLVGVQRRAGVA